MPAVSLCSVLPVLCPLRGKGACFGDGTNRAKCTDLYLHVYRSMAKCAHFVLVPFCSMCRLSDIYTMRFDITVMHIVYYYLGLPCYDGLRLLWGFFWGGLLLLLFFGGGGGGGLPFYIHVVVMVRSGLEWP